MKNYAELLQCIAKWLKRDGELLVHIFTHHDTAYHHEAAHEQKWLARNFLCGWPNAVP